MKIKFRDINVGIVQARASIEIFPDIFINEITILKKKNRIIVELPQKTFKGKDGRIHNIDIITFMNENKKNLWKLEIKDEYKKWRRENPKIEVFDRK